MPENPNSQFLNNPMAAFALLMAAFTPNPNDQLNNLNNSINNIREAINQIDTGLNTFNHEVMPMFMEPGKSEQNTDTE